MTHEQKRKIVMDMQRGYFLHLGDHVDDKEAAMEAALDVAIEVIRNDVLKEMMQHRSTMSAIAKDIRAMKGQNND